MRRRSRLPPLAVVVPVVALQLLAMGSLMVGRDSLVLRDVLSVHLPMKTSQALSLRAGELAMLDFQRGGGQPLLGNPNALPFYPDTALLAVASPIWVLNAHFWLHFLVAPWSAFWLARRLGLPRGAAWAGGVSYALAGFFLAQLSFLNLIGGAALAPALVAASLALRDEGGGRRVAACGGVWGLLLLAGDPTFALLALVAATSALLLVPSPAVELASAPAAGERAGDDGTSTGGRITARWGLPSERRLRTLALLAGALALGTALAAPQLVELLRVLPASTRGVRGFDFDARTMASWDPRQALELVLPFPFGRIDLQAAGAFWGQRYFPGGQPLFLALHPGLLSLALAAVAGGHRGRGRRWAWVICALGVFVALGRFNPLLAPLLRLPGAELLRFPVKAWLLVALGLSMLAAAGWERALSGLAVPAVRRRLRRLLLGAAGGYLVAALVLFLAGTHLDAALSASLAPGSSPRLVAGQAERWATGCVALAGLAGGLALGVLLARDRGRLAATLLLVAHAGSQLLWLGPGTMPRDAVAALSAAPAFASAVGAGTSLVHGSLWGLFGPVPREAPPDGSARWLARQGVAAGYPLVGVAQGWRYELARSPEGLDGYLARVAGAACALLDDPARLRLLRGWGIEVVILERPLAASVAAAHAVRLVARTRGPLAGVWVYRLPPPVPAVRLVYGERHAADPGAALGALLDPTYDPRREVVLAGAGVGVAPGEGRVTVVAVQPESLRFATSSTRPGWLVVDRAWQPQWRARVAGSEVAAVPANLYRLAVAVPAGEHRVELWLERGPLYAGLLTAALAAVALVWLAVGGRSRRGAELPRC